MTEREIEPFLDYLKRKLLAASTVVFDSEQGMATTFPKETYPYVKKEYNGTSTITIKINGGAMDT